MIQTQKKIFALRESANEAPPGRGRVIMTHALLLEGYVGFMRLASLFYLSKSRSFEVFALRDENGSFTTSFTYHEKFRKRSLSGATATLACIAMYALSGVFLPSSITPFAESSSFDFATPGDYTYNSDAIAISGGVVTLKAFEVGDSDDSATGFGGGTKSDTEWNDVASTLELDATGLSSGTGSFTSRIFDAGADFSWENLSWTPYAPYGKELPDDMGSDSGYASENLSMASNQLIMHFDETDADQGELGSDATDESTNANHGNASGTVTYSDEGKFATGITLGGDGAITVPDSASLDLDGEFTIEGWFKETENSLNFIDNLGSTWPTAAGSGCSAGWPQGNSSACATDLDESISDGDFEMVAWYYRSLAGNTLGRDIIGITDDSEYGYGISVSSGNHSNDDRVYIITFTGNDTLSYPKYCSAKSMNSGDWVTLRMTKTGSNFTLYQYDGRLLNFEGATNLANNFGGPCTWTNSSYTNFTKARINGGWASPAGGFYMYAVRPYSTSENLFHIQKGNAWATGFSEDKFAFFRGASSIVDTDAPTLGEWNHLAITNDTATLSLYINGQLVGSRSSGGVSTNDNSLVIGNLFNGSIDEFAIHNSSLDSSAIMSHYLRGALDLEFQVRSCDDAACSGESFIGPDGTIATSYSESENTTAGPPLLSLYNVPDNRYFQYQTTFTSDDNTNSPKVSDVQITSSTYNSTNPTITNDIGIPFSQVSSFTETLGAGNEGTVEYQISNNGSNWYYWNGSSFTEESGSGYPTETSSASEINTNAASIGADVGAGSFYFKAFLHSEGGAEIVQLDDVSVETSTNTNPNDPVIDNYNDGSWVNELPIDLQFDMDDDDAGDIIRYQVQVDNNSDFSSPEIDVTEGSGSAEPRADVTHEVSGLSAGDYYWRVRAIDDDDAPGSWVAANAGGIAFRLDEGAPIASSISINNGVNITTSTSATISLLASDAENSVTEMILSESSDFSGASWIGYATSTAYTLSSGDGTKLVYVKFRDAAGNESGVLSDSILLDTNSPSGTITINSGAGYATSPTVTLTLAGSDATSEVTEMMVSETSTFSDTTWEPYATTKSHTFSNANGSRTIHAKFRDAAENESESTSDSITLDTIAPTGSVSVNSGAAYTSTRSVTLALSATDATSGASEMMISEASSFSGASWQSFASTKAFTLSAGDGTKTVYSRFRDAAGLVSATTSDAIILDTTAPTGSISLNNGSAYILSSTTSVTLTASDGGSGVTEMQVSETEDFEGVSWESFKESKDIVLAGGQGEKTVYAKFKDAAGGISEVVTDTAILDVTSPSGSITINGGSESTTVREVTVSLDVNDTISGVSQMKISESSTLSGTEFESYDDSKVITLSEGIGEKTVYAIVKDVAGNTSAILSDTIDLIEESVEESESNDDTPTIEELDDGDENEQDESSSEESEPEKAEEVIIRVIDEVGDPVEGAEVTLESETVTPVTELSNVEGNAIFRDIAVGQYDVQIAYDGFVGKQSIEVSAEELASSDSGTVDVVVKLERDTSTKSPWTLPLTLGAIGVLVVMTGGAAWWLLRKRLAK